MRRTAFLVVLSFLLLSCSDVPTQAPQKAAVDTPDSPAPQATAEVPTGLGKNFNWDVQKYSNEGDRASAYWYGNGVSGNIYVDHDRGSDQAWLSYSIYVHGEPVQVGWGYVPSEDISGSYESGWFRVDTNTSEDSNPDFYRRDGSGGKITVTWQKIDGWWMENRGYTLQVFTNDNRASAYRGRYKDNSARATGSVVGYGVGGPSWAPAHRIGRYDHLNAWFYFGN